MAIRRNLLACLGLCGCLITLSCGTAPTRTLQSISLTPASGSAGVQFTAVGHWSTDPTLTSPLQARWGVCQNNQPAIAVTVTDAGLATCQKGATGTYIVFAADQPATGPVCNAITACGGGCQISGSAQLTCP